MPVEQGLPWHPVAMGLARQAIPFVVAASHAHALPSPPFWFPVLVASPASLCPSSLSAVLALVPLGVAPAFSVSVLLLLCVCWRSWVPLSRTHSCHTRLPPRTRISRLRTTLTVPRAVGWSRPCCHPRGGHLPARGAQPPPLWSSRAPRGGRGGGLFADGSACAAFGGCCSARTPWSPCALLCAPLPPDLFQNTPDQHPTVPRPHILNRPEPRSARGGGTGGAPPMGARHSNASLMSIAGCRGAGRCMSAVGCRLRTLRCVPASLARRCCPPNTGQIRIFSKYEYFAGKKNN